MQGRDQKYDIRLTNHLKIWFGTILRKNHVNRMIDQKIRNPSHDIMLVVNKEVLDNPNNFSMIFSLRERGIKVLDINEVTDKSNLEDQRLLYAVNEMVKHGLQTKTPKSFAAASDIARWISSIIKYDCKKSGDYRVYSDTDYYFYKVPDRLHGEFLFGDYSQNQIFFKDASVMDANFIAIHPDSELAKAVRKNWIEHFQLDFSPSGYQAPGSTAIKSIPVDSKTVKSLDDEEENTLEKTNPSNNTKIKINDFVGMPGISTILGKVTEFLTDPNNILNQRLNEAIILNLNEGSWTTGKSDERMIGSISVDSISSDNMVIKIEANTNYRNELIKLLIRGRVIPEQKISGNDNLTEFKIVISPDKIEYAKDMLAAFIEARELHNQLQGSLKNEILNKCIRKIEITKPKKTNIVAMLEKASLDDEDLEIIRKGIVDNPTADIKAAPLVRVNANALVNTEENKLTDEQNVENESKTKVPLSTTVKKGITGTH